MRADELARAEEREEPGREREEPDVARGERRGGQRGGRAQGRRRGRDVARARAHGEQLLVHDDPDGREPVVERDEPRPAGLVWGGGGESAGALMGTVGRRTAERLEPRRVLPAGAAAVHAGAAPVAPDGDVAEGRVELAVHHVPAQASVSRATREDGSLCT